MCQLSLRSTLATNTFCRRNLLKPEQATGLASCNWIVHIKAVCWILFFFFHFTSYPPLSNIPNDTFLHRDLAMGYTDAKTCTSSFLTAAVWNVGRWSSSRGAVSHQAALTYCSAPVRSTSFACPTHRRWGLGLTPLVFFSFFPPCSIESLSVDCLVPGTATEHKRQENEEIAFMSYFLGLCCSCHSKAKEMGLFTQRRQV